MAKKDLRINNGGARTGAGRKPVPDKKLPLTLYLNTSVIELLGGIEAAKAHLYKSIQR